MARKYARQYDENEHEFPPDELPEAKDWPDVWSLHEGPHAGGHRASP